MKILSFTTLYPNIEQVRHGIFVENRLRRIAAEPGINLKVVAPVPWFPSKNPAFGQYATYAKVPAQEERFGIEILHPRFPTIPKIGMTLAPYLLYRWAAPVLARMRSEGFDFDLIDAHYFYPDGVAASMLSRRFQRPVVITARGSDINVIARNYALPRRLVLGAARKSAAMIAVAEGLADAMGDVGIERGSVRVLRNGVDLDMFKPVDREQCRREFGVKQPLLVSVGNLVALKGHDLAIRSLLELPGYNLLIVGSGPEDGALKSLVTELGLANRVTFHPGVTHDRMREIYNAGDALILASQSEGWPNVLLESMACGTPVVTTKVSGALEAVSAPAAGRVCAQRTAGAIAESVTELFAARPSIEETRRHAERFDWDSIVREQIALYRNAIGETVQR